MIRLSFQAFISRDTTIAECPELTCDRFCRLRKKIIPYPEFEQVTQDIQGFGIARRAGQKVQQPSGPVGRLVFQVEIGDEERRLHQPSMISMLSIVSGSTGTSAYCPTVSVETTRIVRRGILLGTWTLYLLSELA